MNMELEKKIYKKFNKFESFNNMEIKSQIFNLEYELENSLSDAETLIYQMIIANKSKINEFESLNLIKFVLENYANDYVNKRIKY